MLLVLIVNIAHRSSLAGQCKCQSPTQKSQNSSRGWLLLPEGVSSWYSFHLGANLAYTLGPQP